MANLHRDGAEVNGPGPQDPPDNPRKPHENPGKPPETPRNVPETPGNGRAQAAPLSLADRLPPQNLEAERGLLGSILLDNDVLPDVVGLVTADDFYRNSHQVVYQSILGLHEQGKAIDAITLVDDLIRRDQLQLVGGHEAISQILNSVPHAANARYYAEIVRQKAIGRLLIDAANEILRDGYSNNFTAEQLLAAAEQKVSDIAVAARASAGSSITWVKDVAEREIEWLWTPRVPRRKTWVLAGPGGVGKSFLLSDFAARVSTGAAWPFTVGERAPHGNVLYVSGEDDPDDTLRPRLRLQGADLSKVAVLSDAALATFTMAPGACVAALDKALADMGGQCSLAIIDPPSSFLAKIDENSNAEVRGMLEPLKRWCAKHDVSLAFNAHVNKGAGKSLDVQMRVLGSVAWVNGPRVAHLVTVDPNDPDTRLFIPLKTNIGARTKAVSFRIIPDAEEPARARLEWLALVDIDAQAALEPEAKEPANKQEVIEQWLIGKFRAKRSYPSAQLEAMLLAELNIKAGGTYSNARNAVGIQSGRVGKVWTSHVGEDWIFAHAPDEN
jgi:AAA domain-containing protein/DnaB helicase-like protein